MYDFTFCAVNINVTNTEINQMLNEIRNCADNYWYDDSFRNCRLLPIFNSMGAVGKPQPGTRGSKGVMKWTQAANECPTIKEVMNNKVFPFMDNPGRISILYTPAHVGMNVHMDSNRTLIGTIQHKFRIVLNGDINKLFFLDKNKEKIYVPNNYRCYVLDGAHPHAIDPGEDDKYTLCIGTPWTGNATELYDQLLTNHLYKIQISRPEFEEQWECL